MPTASGATPPWRSTRRAGARSWSPPAPRSPRSTWPAATDASWQAGRLLAYGGTWDDRAERTRGTGLTVYGPGGRPPRHLLGAEAVMEAHLDGGLLYAAVDTGDEEYGRRVVSLASGRVLSSSRAPLPWLLLGQRGPTC